MESESTISKLNKYRQFIIDHYLLDDFIDFLYSQKIIVENNYFAIYSKKIEMKLYEIFKIIESKENGAVEKVYKYLDNLFPNMKKLLEDEEKFRICRVRGGFPKLPPNYVTRESLKDDLKSKLLDLEWKQKLIVLGMLGYGKSCLVNEVLEDETILKCFDYNVFWINLGDHNKETILQPLCGLYTTASKVVGNNMSHCPEDDVQVVKRLLIDLFLHSRLRNALIILDNASNKDVLTYFDFKCRTVITTQDRDIFYKEQGVLVEVKTGFSKDESLELFKKSLNINHELPLAAEEIHNICKGHPMLIAHIGSYLNEIRKDWQSNEIWEYIKHICLHGDYRLNEYDSQDEIPTTKIQKCIEQLLANGLKQLYHDLAIFMPDINIPPEVLEILWDKSKIEVKNTMNKFVEKSLIVPFYHKDLKTYIYGIHGIHLKYLKEITKEQTVSLHKKLIDGYDKITQGDYSALPNDNYILQYIGYHLYHAREYKKFEIYFNLKFLEAKIRATGKGDVLRDMKVYENRITNNDNKLKDKLEQYKDFIRRCGSIFSSDDKTDIIQLALREEKGSPIFQEALALAEKSQKLYFQLQRPVDEFDYATIHVLDDITSACFVDSPQLILIGTSNGKIKLFYEEYEKEFTNFVGHKTSIKKLIVSPDKRYFLSISVDGIVMLWKFAADSARNSDDLSYLPASPKLTQRQWQDIITPDRRQVTPKKIFKTDDKDDLLISAAFCEQFPATFKIATGSLRGNVVIWDASSGNQLYNTGPRGFSVPCVIYPENDTMRGVIFACDDSILIYKFEDRLVYSKTLHNPGRCDSIFLTNNKIIAVSNQKVTLWENNKKDIIFKTEDDINKYNICSTLTNDFKYLVVSTDKNTVYILNVEDKKVIKEFNNEGLALSLDTFFDDDNSVHILLIGSDHKTLQQCHILPNKSELEIANTSMFIPYWKKNRVLTALVTKDNKIQVFNGYGLFSETNIIQSQVMCTCFSTCGRNVIYGLQNGEVHLFNMSSKSSSCIERNSNNEISGPITYLQCFSSNCNRTESFSSCNSSDSLDFDNTFEGIVIAVSNSNIITAYNPNIVGRYEVDNPLIFFKMNSLIIFDNSCQIYIWNLLTDSFVQLSNSREFKEITVYTATFCTEKSLLGAVYRQNHIDLLDIYHQIGNTKSVKLLKRIELSGEVKSACFSCDGSLLAIGMTSGDIVVWNLNQNFKSIILKLHDSPVTDLLFSPSLEPILVSLGQHIAWWNLKLFQVPQCATSRQSQRKRRPNSIEILENVTKDMASIDISFWADKKCLDGTDYLLSCMKLQDRARFLSASKDFSSFLTVDDKGKIYIMEIIPQRL